jgi:predicted phosphoribosyltransferase/pimeloyl-ACP methyl ester carboxylesterase
MLINSNEVGIPFADFELNGTCTIPKDARGIIIFAHGSGSSRQSPRNQFVAKALNDAGFATLLMDLLSESEEADRANVFAIDLLAQRVVAAIDWLTNGEETEELPIGLFGASTGSAAALEAAAQRPALVRAVVSRGGRPDLAWHALPRVMAPTLLIVGERDPEVLQFNRSASRRLQGFCDLRIVPNATHLFEEPGTLQRVASLAKDWFIQHLANGRSRRHSSARRFADRADAARRLAVLLKDRTLTNPLVLAIPRGGVLVGAGLAEALNADLDVILARKLGMPDNPEFALGAIAENGEVYLNVPEEDIPPYLQAYVAKERRQQKAEIGRRRSLFRNGRLPVPVKGRSVIVVDDGIATGATMIAALRALRMQKPRELIVAVPVAAPDRLRQVERECDEAVSLIVAPDLHAVGEYYDDFSQVEDSEVVAALEPFADHATTG